jgi:hypothetical protein
LAARSRRGGAYLGLMWRLGSFTSSTGELAARRRGGTGGAGGEVGTP